MSKTKNTPAKTGSREPERKFLVAELPAANLARPQAQAVEQGYLVVDAGRKIEVHVRRYGKRCCLTVKQGERQQRIEVEVPLDKSEFNALWPATKGQRIVKSRHRLPKKGTGAEKLELDVYEGELAGLRVAEVEFTDEVSARAFGSLAWFGREVTEDSAYRNATLARHGLPAGTTTGKNA